MSLKSRLRHLESKQPKHRNPYMMVILLAGDSEATKIAKRDAAYARAGFVYQPTDPIIFLTITRDDD